MTQYVVAHKGSLMFWDGSGFTADRKQAKRFDFLSIGMLEREWILNSPGTCQLELVVIPVNDKWVSE